MVECIVIVYMVMLTYLAYEMWRAPMIEVEK